MPTKKPGNTRRTASLRIRVLHGSEIALGPGKVDLLAHIRDTGSIREAASEMGMSYMRAWTLVQTMNRLFKKPLVVAARGGAKQGGAVLTDTGKRALQLYADIEKAAVSPAVGGWRALRLLLRG